MKPVFGCSTNSLRALNVLASCLICFSSFDILRLLRTPPIQRQDKAGKAKHRQKDGRNDSSSFFSLCSDASTALNVALFPPLFFFSALFYTDVMSTLAVLLSYNVFLRKKTVSGSLSDNIIAVLVGVMALLFRQTNIFWVAVFPAGLAVTAALGGDALSAKSSKPSNASEVLQQCWKDGLIHDCAVQDAASQGKRTRLDDSPWPVLIDHRLRLASSHYCTGNSAETAASASGHCAIHSPSCTFRKLRTLEWKCRTW